MSIQYNKLVHDNIPEILRMRGISPVTHIADETEYWEKLKEKLAEEVAEFTKDSNIEELADITEVIEAIMIHQRFDRAELEKVRAKKAEERGAFVKRIILDEA